MLFCYSGLLCGYVGKKGGLRQNIAKVFMQEDLLQNKQNFIQRKKNGEECKKVKQSLDKY